MQTKVLCGWIKWNVAECGHDEMFMCRQRVMLSSERGLMLTPYTFTKWAARDLSSLYRSARCIPGDIISVTTRKMLVLFVNQVGLLPIHKYYCFLHPESKWFSIRHSTVRSKLFKLWLTDDCQQLLLIDYFQIHSPGRHDAYHLKNDS